MVCSIAQPYSKLTKYAEEDRITKDKAIENSRWFGTGAVVLGLSDKVNSISYKNLYDGRDDRGTSLRKKLAGKNSRPGRDLTFSAPKSVSLLALVEENKQVTAAHNKAVDFALTYIEQNCIYTRMGRAGSTRSQTNNMITAVFEHEDSRNFDPNLHSHCVIFNQTKGNDGKWRAMDNRELYRQRITIGLIYHNELSHELLQQGYSVDWKPDGTFDIAGISRDSIDRFSSRRAEIIDAVGIDSSARQKELACISTRINKKYISSAERKALKNSWRSKHQQAISKSNRSLLQDKSFTATELIDASIDALKSDGRTSFTKPELLKQSLIFSQGQHSLQSIQSEIKNHPHILNIEKNALTTIDLYRENKIREEKKRLPQTSPVERLAIKAISNLKDKTIYSNEIEQKSKLQHKVVLKNIPDPQQLISQCINEYIKNIKKQKLFSSIILTDSELDKKIITSKLREKLVLENVLGKHSISSIGLKPKKLTYNNITKIENYQIGNAVKFHRASKRFSNQYFYKVISLDKQTNTLLLGSRFGDRVNLPLHRYKNREVFEVEKRELRTNEKIKFTKGQLINGRQIPPERIFTIKRIKDKHNIIIESFGKLNTVKIDKLLLSEYGYADTIDGYKGNKVDSCIYYPSKNASEKLIKTEAQKAASLTVRELSMYISVPTQQQQQIINDFAPDYNLPQESDGSLKSIDKQHITDWDLSSNKDKSLKIHLTKSNVETNQFTMENKKQAIQDLNLSELASSSQHIVLNKGIKDINIVDKKIFVSSDELRIEKEPESLLINYEEKSIEFDRDFNLVSNNFSEQEIRQIARQIKEIKQEIREEIKQNRQNRIQRGLDLTD